MGFNHIKAFLNKRDEAVPHESDYITSTDTNKKRALDVNEASLNNLTHTELLRCIFTELQLVNRNLSIVIDEELDTEEIRKD